MALSFPLSPEDLADLLPIESCSWDEFRMETASGLGDGEFLTHSMAPVLWQADVTLRALPHAQAEQIAARLRALESHRRFYLYNPVMQYPQADPGGVLLADAEPEIASINANRRALALSGLPVPYTITLGDYLAIDYGSPDRRALVQVVETVTSTSGGVTAEFEVRPHLRPGINNGLPVILIKPAAKVKIVPGSVSVRAGDGVFTTVGFTARQTLAAG